MHSSGMTTMGTADLVIAVAYFFIPAEIAMYLLRRRCVIREGGMEGGRGGMSHVFIHLTFCFTPPSLPPSPPTPGT